MGRDGGSRRRFQLTALVIVGLGLLGLLGYYLQGSSLIAKDETAQNWKILMDTIVEVRVDGPRAQELVAKAFQEMEKAEQILSRFVETSDVSEINRRAGEWVLVQEPTLQVLQAGLEVAEISKGAFDVTIGAVMDLWGFGSERQGVPGEEELTTALSTVDYTQVEVDTQTGQVRIPKGTVLELGGIAKGYAVDLAVEMLRANGIRSALVNAGGDISALGKRPDGNFWRVGVQNHNNPSEIDWILLLDGSSVLTSGDYQRFFEEGDERWHHIIDPHSGYPARGLRSVTVVSESAAFGDALATVVFVLGWDKGRRLVESLPHVEAILVTDADTWVSPGLAGRVIAQ